MYQQKIYQFLDDFNERVKSNEFKDYELDSAFFEIVNPADIEKDISLGLIYTFLDFVYDSSLHNHINLPSDYSKQQILLDIQEILNSIKHTHTNEINIHEDLKNRILNL